MKFLVRCDSSIKIGTGHVVRCLHLAEMILKKQHEVFFVCKELTGNIISLIEEKQIKVVRLPSSLNFENELAHIDQILSVEKPDFVILDHYYLPLSWEKTIKSHSIPLLVIDDSFSKLHECDFFINQNFVTETKNIGTKGNFIGPEYALLSAEFLQSRPSKKINQTIKKILIFFGGTDPNGDTMKYLQMIKNIGLKYQFNVVVGKNNPYIPQIKTLIDGWDDVILHIQTNKMSVLMQQADLFIGAGGTVTWERCFLGLPALVISTADNQEEIARCLDRYGIHKYLGKSNVINEQLFKVTLLSIINNPELRNDMSSRSLSLNVSSKIQNIINTITKS